MSEETESRPSLAYSRDGSLHSPGGVASSPAPPSQSLTRTASYDDDGRTKRTGTLWTASAHIITAVIGSGVLSLPWSIAQLGWIAGPVVLVAFAFVTYFTSLLLSDCYRSPDPVVGKRNYTYMDAIRSNLGGLQILLCGVTQYANLLGASIGYTITASISMVLWWLSIVAAIMSFSYSTTGLGLAIAKVTEPGHSYGSIEGITRISHARKVWSMFQALGNIAFAYSFSVILIEIQDTLKSPPPENKTMKKATLVGVSTTTIFYMLCGCFGYAAFGNNVPGNLLTGFGFYNPYWLVDIANMCIVVHLIGAYQVYTQPLFAFVEKWVSTLNLKSQIINKEYSLHIPVYGNYNVSLFRLIWRTVFVVVTTLVSMLVPFFNDILGILGAVAFWPLTVYFPTQMFMAQNNIQRWTRTWVLLQALSLICLLVSLAALLGSMEGVVHDMKAYEPFKTHY